MPLKAVFFPPSGNKRFVRKIQIHHMRRKAKILTLSTCFFRTTAKKFADVPSKQLQVYRVYSFLTMCSKINTLPVWMQTGWESDSKQ